MPLLPLLRHALQQASLHGALLLQHQYPELLLQQETLADACWAIDGLVTRSQGVVLLLESPPLLHHVLHILAHSSSSCCCPIECSSSSAAAATVAGPVGAAVTTRAFELDVSTGLKNPCCRICNPQLSHLQQQEQQQQHMLLPLHPALRIVGQIAAGTARQTQQLLSCCCCSRCLECAAAAAAAADGGSGSSSSTSAAGTSLVVSEGAPKPCCARGAPLVLRCLRTLLLRMDRPSLCREACWALSNLAVGSSQQLQQLLQCSILRHALLMLQQQHLGDDLRKEALWLVSNACITATTLQQILPMLQHGAMHQLWALLEAAAAAADGRAAEAALNALSNVVFLAELAQQQQRQQRNLLQQRPQTNAVSCGCCNAAAAAAAAAVQCSCCCHEPLIMLSSLMPGEEGLLLLQQVHQQHLTAAVDRKSDELACKLLQLREVTSPYMPCGTRNHHHLYVN